MAKLVIVESPAKAKSIQKYLGDGYEVVASMGHIRDLPKSLLGVDVEHGFRPRYTDIPGKTALIKQLKQRAATADGVILATDPDREGEAISWHLAQMLQVDPSRPNRVTFNEITRSGVLQGMAHPRPLDMNMVNAQQARRILDRLVGYRISPFLWRKIRRGLSAGRVQSVALRLVVDREEEISAFKAEEYWTVDAVLADQKSGVSFPARFYGTVSGKRELKTHEEAEQVLAAVRQQSFTVTQVKQGTRRLTPAPPFTTSTLQQEASRKLGFTSQRTMRTAQELYEGVDVANYGTVGLITYMRTDSLRISDEARQAGVAFIRQKYGDAYVPRTPHQFKQKAGAQDAHEAIRPSMPHVTPDEVRKSLTNDQYLLYKLVWDRFTASLMAACVQNTCRADITAGNYVFKASGHTVTFDGFTVLYVEGRDDAAEDDGALPPLTEGMPLTAASVDANQHFTQPPARFTEATLIKALEDNGIGRPSTYAPTITTILSREYIERVGKALKPTALGEVTTRLMKEQFPEIVDVDFTATMEKQLDDVDGGKVEWVDTLQRFYDGFVQTLAKAEASLSEEHITVPEEESDVVCEKCGRRMVIKVGRYGKFLACPGYPDCKNTKRLIQRTGGVCPLCGGNIVAKRSKNNRLFYGCDHYPDCHFVTWNEPVSTPCPRCGKTLFRKKGKKAELFCLTDGCGYRQEE